MGFEAKIVFGVKQVSNIQIPDSTLSVGPKNQIYIVSSKVRKVKRKNVIGIFGSKNYFLGSLESSNWSKICCNQ